MKQFFTIAVILVSLQLYGQKKIVWFDMGAKVQYGAAGLYNAAIANSDGYDYNISTGYSYGGKLGINFGYNGLAIDVMRSTAKQEFEKTGSTAVPTVNWQSWDVYALFRNAKNLGYFEIGPKISFVSKVEDNLVDGGSVGTSLTDRTTNYNKNNIAGVIGFGANIMGNDGAFSGILGLRLEYSFTDFVGPEGATIGANGVNAPLRDPLVYADGYKKSNVAFAGLVFELNWGIGYFAKAQCGARSKFIMF
ncbi:MAG TPA: hypothetical protein PKD51_14285 [Saprospiraceae bacterium]|nr:hypothetical protein [Saprospiraceae bacterium]